MSLYWERLKDELLTINTADARTKIEFESIGDEVVLRCTTVESTLSAVYTRSMAIRLDAQVVQALEDFLLDQKAWEEIRPKLPIPEDVHNEPEA